MSADTGTRNLIVMFAAVALVLMTFYGYLAWNALGMGSVIGQLMEAEPAPSGSPVSVQHRERAPAPAQPAHPNIARGKQLYLDSGCALCHGVAGVGRVRSPNYVADAMPALNVLAERMFLIAPEDADLVIKALEPGKRLNAASLDVPRAGAVAAQFESIREVILSGNPGGKKDPAGHAPLDMPRWDGRLNESEVSDVIAYLLSLYPWDQPGQQ